MEGKIEDRAKEFMKEINPIGIKYNIMLGAELTFPRYNIIPTEVSLALEVLKIHGAECKIILKDKIK